MAPEISARARRDGRGPERAPLGVLRGEGFASARPRGALRRDARGHPDDRVGRRRRRLGLGLGRRPPRVLHARAGPRGAVAVAPAPAPASARDPPAPRPLPDDADALAAFERAASEALVREEARAARVVDAHLARRRTHDRADRDLVDDRSSANDDGASASSSSSDEDDVSVRARRPRRARPAARRAATPRDDARTRRRTGSSVRSPAPAPGAPRPGPAPAPSASASDRPRGPRRVRAGRRRRRVRAVLRVALRRRGATRARRRDGPSARARPERGGGDEDDARYAGGLSPPTTTAADAGFDAAALEAEFAARTARPLEDAHDSEALARRPAGEKTGGGLSSSGPGARSDAAPRREALDSGSLGGIDLDALLARLETPEGAATLASLAAERAAAEVATTVGDVVMDFDLEEDDAREDGGDQPGRRRAARRPERRRRGAGGAAAAEGGWTRRDGMAPRSRERGGGIVAKTPMGASATRTRSRGSVRTRHGAREKTSDEREAEAARNRERRARAGTGRLRSAGRRRRRRRPTVGARATGARSSSLGFSRGGASPSTVRINAWETEKRGRRSLARGSNPSDPAPAPEPAAEEASGENPKARAGGPEGPSPDDAAAPSKPPLDRLLSGRRRGGGGGWLKSPPVRRSPGPAPSLASPPASLRPSVGGARRVSSSGGQRDVRARRLRGRGGGVFRVARDSPRRRRRAGEPRGGAFETGRLRSGGVGRVAVPRPRSGPRQGEAQASARAESDGRFPRRARRPRAPRGAAPEPRRRRAGVGGGEGGLH